MTTVSIRDTCDHCLDKTGTLSVRRDLFGYPYGPIDRDLRIHRHIDNIRAKAINLCVFFVGHEPGFTGTFTQAQAISTQHAIDLMREIYEQADIGVRKIFWRYIHDADATSYITVDAGEATDLTEAYSGPNDGIDLFMVQTISDAGGWSNSDGPCDKDDKGRTGAVVEVNTSSDDFLGIIVAHEVGHYLGLVHTNSATNLMGVDSNNDGIGEITLNSRDITSGQRSTMRSSCWVRDAC
ncbi:zinc-dependent metalloprotease family protein [Ideonella sp. BN130291]|uniref:zinc-dependent metalloprotease family protein n=1 Tax=Ideonella sp. BN130291 TaxID=3112940 RepID=UPI002E26B039|nr:zinc-dependent metalloprotease family protein [Ideonella sp. BN130291]